MYVIFAKRQKIIPGGGTTKSRVEEFFDFFLAFAISLLYHIIIIYILMITIINIL